MLELILEITLGLDGISFRDSHNLYLRRGTGSFIVNVPQIRVCAGLQFSPFDLLYDGMKLWVRLIDHPFFPLLFLLRTQIRSSGRNMGHKSQMQAKWLVRWRELNLHFKPPLRCLMNRPPTICFKLNSKTQ